VSRSAPIADWAGIAKVDAQARKRQGLKFLEFSASREGTHNLLTHAVTGGIHGKHAFPPFKDTEVPRYLVWVVEKLEAELRITNDVRFRELIHDIVILADFQALLAFKNVRFEGIRPSPINQTRPRDDPYREGARLSG